MADINNHTIRKITTAGVVTTLAGAAGVLGSSAGSGTAATFGYPTGVAVDAAGNVYVADYYNYTIRKITAAGVVTTLAGKAGEGGSADGTGPKARFDAPSAITIDSAGNMYVADLGNHTIRKINPGYHLGGTVSGLTDTLILQNSNGETKTISGDGSFTLDMPVAARAAYSVTVKTQPANGQTCSVNSGGGTATTHVSNIAVSCTTGASVATYTLGGAVNGLSTPLIGTLVLQNSNGDTRIIAGNGLFTFTAPVAQAAAYSVTVTTQPNGQTCTVGSGSGTATADVSTIAVSCVASTYTIGVVVGGLTGTLALRNNGTDTLTITTNANFTFATRITHGGTYNVTVMNQPAGQTCTVRDALSANASGTAKGDVGTITVNCVANTYTIGGAVSGLSGGALVLQNNLGDNLSLTASGSLTFATAITHGGAYNVTVLTQPAGQTCTVTAGGIGMATTNVTNVAVNCVISGGGGTTFTISGTVNGLNSVDLVLQNNGGDNLQVFPGAPGMPVPFTFATPVTGTYVVTVLTNPATENCTVTSGGSGTATVDVSDVVIDCATRP